MAKDASAQRASRASKAKSKYANSSSPSKESEKPKSTPGTKKQVKGEAVSAVDNRAEYYVYKLVEGKEVHVLNKDGSIAIRTGAQIREKMIYSPSRKGWEHKVNKKKYIVRRRN